MISAISLVGILLFRHPNKLLRVYDDGIIYPPLSMMKTTFFIFLILLFLNGCYTNKGELPDGTTYLEYDVQFDKEEAGFHAPLTNDLEEVQKENK